MVSSLACPSKTWITRISMCCSSRCVAKLCLLCRRRHRRHYVSFRTMSGIRKGLQISSEISDQVARGFCQLSNIVLPAYGRAIARSVECWGYRCLRNDFRNRPMCAGHKAFCNRSRAICSSTVHRSWLVAPCRLDRRSQNYVACDRRNLPGKPDQNREYPT